MTTQYPVPLFRAFTLRLRHRLLPVTRPLVMGIVNVTPDSFYAESRNACAEAVERRVAQMVEQGVDILDIGGYSSRPGADEVSPEEELARLRVGIEAAKRMAPQIPVSIDTFRAKVARVAITDMGADIVNDISGGLLDPDMLNVMAHLSGVPYILMHMRGTPANMTSLTDYPDGVVADVIKKLAERIDIFHRAGVADVIADPGFGFAKTVQQNYTLLRNLGLVTDTLQVPMLVGVSRKSMFTKPLGITADDALPATTAAHVLALMGGASILRVHDVAAARQAIDVVSLTYPAAYA